MKETSAVDYGQDFQFPPEQTNNEAERFEENFDSRAYLEQYYPPLEQKSAQKVYDYLSTSENENIDAKAIAEELGIPIETVENICIIKFQAGITKELLKEYPEDHISVLDVGGGPTAYQHIGLSFVADDIVHSEFLKQNREEAQKWILDKPDAYNWDSYLEFVKDVYKKDPEFIQLYEAAIETQLSNKDQLYVRLSAEKKKKILDEDGEAFKLFVRRNLIGHTIPVDTFREDLGVHKYGYDHIQAITRQAMTEVVSSNFMIESATEDREKWRLGLKNITARVKSGGYLALTAIRNAEWYSVGDNRMPAVPVDGKDLTEELESLGFEIKNIQEISGSDKEKTGYDGMVFVLAKNKGERSEPRYPTLDQK